jgi:syntaxin 6
MTPPMHHSDYSIASTDERVMTGMDEVSLSSRSMAKSVVSKLSRLTNPNGGKSSSLTSTNNSDMASSLLLPMSERDEGEGNDGHDALIRGDNNGGGGVVIIPNNSSAAAPTTTTKSYISEDDPFHIFASDLTNKLINVSSALHAYLTIVDTSDTSTNINKVRECKRILKTSIKLAEETLNDLETTIRVVDKRRIDFEHIDDAEMYERRHFINGGKDELARTKMRMQGDDVRKKLSNDERKHRRRSSLERQQRQQQQQQQQQKQRQVDDRNGNISNNGYNYTDNDNNSNNNNNNNNDNNDYNHERTETMLIMQRQDETLHDLDMAVTRVSYMADTIHTEIESQNVMLNKLEDELIDAEEQLGVVMGKLARLLKTKNKCQLGLILMLSLVVLVLFFLVLYT